MPYLWSPKRRGRLLSGHTAALVWLVGAGLAVGAALFVLLWATFDRSLLVRSAPAIETASAWIAFFGVLAAVIAIVAAYVEIRTLFPAQELQVRVLRKPVDDWELDICRLVFSNESDSALINAYRLEVWVESPEGVTQGHYGRDPSGPSGGDAEWERAYGDEMHFFPFRWVLLRAAPFFPGTEVEAPFVDMSANPGKWRALWHADRSSSTGPLTFDIPTTPTE